ncbi:MAG: hypothetical protein ACQEQF_01840 [Bacillota bacterium]
MVNIDIDNRAEILGLMEVANKLDKKERMNNTPEDFLGWEITDIVDIILDLINIPRDNSLDYEPTDEKYFCRDEYYAILFDFVQDWNDYTAEEILDMILSLKEGNNYEG